MSNSNQSITKNTSAIAIPNAQANTGWAILSQSPVRNFPKRDVFNVVLIGVAKSFADLNIKSISLQERDYMVNELTDNIIARHRAIRINEIPDAIARGIRGEYGEFYGLSVVAFERFIARYLLSESRVRAVKESQQQGAAKAAPGKQEQFALAKSNALMALERKKTNQPIYTIASFVYDFLDKLQLLQFSSDEKYDMMADAARELVGELRFKLLTASGHQRMALRQSINAYTAALSGGTLTAEQKQNVVRLSKRLAIEAFLQQVMLEEIDMAALIEGRKELF
ncbi:MAG: hypothetical protein JWP37_4554 [Mucilaginibacter sp.]|nr:hypothetical protein [Mucilaginibacter sp.]